ncbi:hypothetical protein SE17_04060 [Kouleothrix aurantiaca]|uniref:FtsK domain-containing protein n=1 Tax=Kouleothrix aurantiaca TaxID=186479 RepID=A0A0P9HHT5_9CHLR|nr:hypothetical protein SE17_04060 [Kouleothrix aurantiaca]
MDVLSILVPIAVILSIPTYLWLKERGRRKHAEAALACLGPRPQAPAKASTFVPWLEDADDDAEPPPAAAQPAAAQLAHPVELPPQVPVAQITRPLLAEPLQDLATPAPATPQDAWVVDRSPPAGIYAVRQALDAATDDPYAFGVMWVKPKAGGDRALVYASLADGPTKVNFLLGTGEPEHGKNVLIDHMLIPLLQRATPNQLRVCVFDGTRADGALTRGLPHNWIEPLLIEADVALGMRAWRLERRRREALLDQYGVTKWERLPDHARPPMLLFVVNELTVLAKGMTAKAGRFEDWIDVELKAMRKCGMRAWLFTQNVSGMQTNWRDNCSMKLAGYQPVDRLAEPNTGLNAAEIRKAGALAPNELIERGMFTLIEKGSVITGRTSYLDDDERVAAFRALGPGSPRYVTTVVHELTQQLGEDDAPSSAAPPAPAPMMPAQNFADMPLDDQFSVIRGWSNQGLTGNEMLERMKPIQRQRGQAIIRDALGRQKALLLGVEEAA